MEEAYKVGLCNNTMLDGSVNPREQDAEEAERNKLDPYRAYYLATLGGAHALYLDDLLGNFDKGKRPTSSCSTGMAASRPWRGTSRSSSATSGPGDARAGGRGPVRDHGRSATTATSTKPGSPADVPTRRAN